ncbi:recombinase-like helix-turn-helix domain-containing protein [Rhodococcus erythropolis]|uniref:recombinase-like helix-turn-helix domain-containing protein n=1 Tax=Rhodococcus erythropolis TaxID=1833 RepID=UPI002949BC8C|nr:recombinase-like helix-turn-helix domain-containing protein [Rhodococcus erythropolis]MDV6275102.1 recombinase-like helix-turn-helix domain-containing protein [Rhodococcus erythropolis]
MSLYLVEHQARSVPATPYEAKLAGAIEEVFGSGRHDLDGLVDGLNQLGMLAPNGEPWTADVFTAEIARMGAQ